MKPQFIKEIRSFNRFYTNIIGLLDRHILNSAYSLPEVRVMFELYHNTGITASGIIALIDIDKGYLSRILQNFEKKKLITKDSSPTDKRITVLHLTLKGKKEFELLNNLSDIQVENNFKHLSEKECEKLIQEMFKIQQLLNSKKWKK